MELLTAIFAGYCNSFFRGQLCDRVAPLEQSRQAIYIVSCQVYLVRSITTVQYLKNEIFQQRWLFSLELRSELLSILQFIHGAG